jgi:hypothetical protein
MSDTGKLVQAMITYYTGDARRINHFLKVYSLAKAIGEMEGLDEYTQEILEAAALTHDIGIRNSELKYQSSSGSHQQIEGPPEAQKLLAELGYGRPVIDRVCWLIAHHHTYNDIQGNDYQILVEADFLVNAFEDNLSADSIRSIRNKIFKTKIGTAFLDDIYLKQ